jgi:hypothetical protein
MLHHCVIRQFGDTQHISVVRTCLRVYICTFFGSGFMITAGLSVHHTGLLNQWFTVTS